MCLLKDFNVTIILLRNLVRHTFIRLLVNVLILHWRSVVKKGLLPVLGFICEVQQYTEHSLDSGT